MIELKVNGVEQSFDGEPEMPFLWKEHERSGPSIAGSPEADRCATRSNHCQWQRRNAILQEFS